MPTTVVFTVNPAGGADYTALNTAISTEAEDLTASDQIHVFRYTGGATADTTAVPASSFANYTCDATRYIQIEVASGQEHGGAWNTSAPRLETTDASCIGLPIATGKMYHIVIRGLQLHTTATTGSTNRRCINAALGITVNSIFDIQNCILRVDKTGGTATSHSGIEITDTNWATVRIANNLILMTGTTVGHGISRNSTGNVYVHNNGVVGATNTAYIDVANSATGTFQLKNNWAYQCGTFSSGLGVENSDYNSTDLATATGGANDRVSQTFTFVNAAGGDYRPDGDDAAIRGRGVDLSGDANLPITTDMEGVAVHSPPDIGPLNAESSEEGPTETRWRIYRAAA